MKRLLILCFAGALISQSVFAQKNNELRITDTNSKTLVARPNDLTVPEKLKLAQQLAGQKKIDGKFTGIGGSFKITIRNPYVENQHDLLILGIDKMNFKESYARVMPSTESKILNSVNCRFKPIISGSYLVDIPVKSADQKKIEYKLRVLDEGFNDNVDPFSMTIPDNIGRVSFILQVTGNNKWHTIWLGGDNTFLFYGCDITLMK